MDAEERPDETSMTVSKNEVLDAVEQNYQEQQSDQNGKLHVFFSLLYLHLYYVILRKEKQEKNKVTKL